MDQPEIGKNLSERITQLTSIVGIGVAFWPIALFLISAPNYGDNKLYLDAVWYIFLAGGVSGLIALIVSWITKRKNPRIALFVLNVPLYILFLFICVYVFGSVFL